FGASVTFNSLLSGSYVGAVVTDIHGTVHTNITDFSVTVTNPPPGDPNTPTFVSKTCGQVTLNVSHTGKPSNETWYWQSTNSSGYSTTLGSGTSFTDNVAAGTHTFYIRSRNNVTLTWGAIIGSVPITVNSSTTAPTAPSPAPICTGQTTFITASGVAGATYRWYDANDNYLNFEGANYGTGVLNTSTTFKVSATVNGCESGKTSVLVNVHGTLSAGGISNAQTICYNGNPSTLSSSSGASGGDGNYSYQWQYSNNGTSGWTDISSANSTTYNPPGSLTADRWYRRGVSSCNGTVYTNSVKVTVRSPLTAGNINGAQTICYNSDPTNLGSTSSPSGGDGVYSYQWEYSTNNSSWNSISGATSASYNPSTNLTADRWYRRTVTSCGETKTTASIKVTVRATLQPGSISGAQTICYNNDPTNLGNVTSPSGGNASYSYQWEYSTNNSTWNTISGATSASYNPSTNLTADRWYRRAVTSCGETKNSNTIKVTVEPQLAVPSGADIVPHCGSGPVNLTLTPDSNANEVRWYSAATGGTFLGTGTYAAPASNATYYASSYNSTSQCESASRKSVTVTITTGVDYYLDADGDNFAVSMTTSCTSPGAGYTSTVLPLGDCDDNDATLNPDTVWFLDADGDNHAVSSTQSCTNPGTGYTRTVLPVDDCDDTDAAIFQQQTWYLDADQDGYYISTTQSCTSPGAGYTLIQGQANDCDDNDPNIKFIKWYEDNDQDGLGDPNSTAIQQCNAPVGDYVNNNDDTCPNDPTNTCLPNNAPLCHVDNLNLTISGNNYIYSRTYQQTAAEMGISQSAAVAYFQENDGLLQEITYFDGLGRPIQQLGIDQSPGKNDIVTHLEYDDYGRMEKEYLPFHTTDGTIGSFRPGAKAAIEAYYDVSKYENTLNPYSQKLFETSPLNRVEKQAAPGNDWALTAGDDRSIEFDYLTNTHDPANPTDSSNDNVKMFRVSTVASGNTYDATLEFGTDGTNTIEYYTQGELYKNITKDENHTGTSKNHTTEEFTDKQGRVVLKRTYADMDLDEDGIIEAGETELLHDTYYVYDDFGNLSYVLPPKMDASTASLTNLNANLNELGYQYVYDHRNRLVEKRIPGKGWEYIVYNTLNQPIMTQDANQAAKSPKEWLFTKYDAFGRVAYTGKATDNQQRHEIQADVDAETGDAWVVQSSNSIDIGGLSTLHYNDEAYPRTTVTPTVLTEVLTVNYYDDYVDKPAGAPASIVLLGSATNETNSGSVKGLATVSRVKVLDVTGSNVWINTLTYYDDKGRPVYVYSDNTFLGVIDIVETQLDFIGKPLKTRSTHTKGSTTIVTIDNFNYDHVGRLVAQTQCIGDASLGDSCPAGQAAPANPIYTDTPGTSRTDIATTSITLKDGFEIIATASLSYTATIDPNATGGDAGRELIVLNDYDELGQLRNKKVGGATAASIPASPGLQQIDYTYTVRGWLKGINDNDTSDNTLTMDAGDLFGFRIGYNEGNALYNGNIALTQWQTANADDSSLKTYNYEYDALNRITKGSDNTAKYELSKVAYDKNGNIMKLTRLGH
ncbi:MAG: DUF6443 domain-containing protein, partial [Flavobacteriaceae bacterium]